MGFKRNEGILHLFLFFSANCFFYGEVCNFCTTTGQPLVVHTLHTSLSTSWKSNILKGGTNGKHPCL